MTWWRSPGILYFFAAGNPPIAIKIGVTSVGKGGTFQQAIRKRFKAIQSHNHESIELLGIIRFTEGETPMGAAETHERELHVKFGSSQRFKRHTLAAEWFTPTDDLLAYIRDHAETPEVLGVPAIIAQSANRQ